LAGKGAVIPLNFERRKDIMQETKVRNEKTGRAML